jgi:oxygen-independent coproporphyrinogen-3 oxidase
VNAPLTSAEALAALLERYDRPGPRYTSYPTAVEFTDAFDEAAYRGRLADAGARADDLALYLHLPFCEARCTYCACNMVASPFGRRVTQPYLDRLFREFTLTSEALGRRAAVSRIHLGGGTPTYHTPEELDAILGALGQAFDLSGITEASVEADPRVTSSDQLRTLARHGFTRLSVGVQDLDPDVQEAIGRVQTAEESREVVDSARKAGFGSVNVDLVYGLPRQTVASIQRTLDSVLALAPDRLAIYSFAYLPSAFGHQRKISEDDVPSGAEKVALLTAIRERLLTEGYTDIGIDHFARPDDALAVAQREGRLRRDFMGYTTRESREYLGFGISAIGYVGGAYVQNVKKLSRYYAALDEGRLPVERGVQLDEDDLMRASVISDLMCNFVVHKADFESRFGRAFDATFADDLPGLAPLEAEGFVVSTPDAIRITPLGRYLARNAAMCFDRYRRGDGHTRFSRTL